MADATNALALALLGQQPRKISPISQQYKLGNEFITQGSSTAPVRSPLEGIARSLQGVLGGWVARDAVDQQKAEDQSSIGALTGALGAKDQAGMTEALKSYKGDSDVVAPLLAQLVAQKQQQFGLADAASRLGQPLQGGVVPSGSQAQPPASGAPASSPAGFANNSGNIRSTAPGNASGFAVFDTPQAGANAQAGNFGAYVQANPNMTVAQALAKWSPPNENNTQGVIKTISENSGVNPGMLLGDLMKDPAAFATFMDAQTRLEKGGMPQGFTADTFMRAASPQGAATPQVAAAPSVPDVPRPQPSPEMLDRVRQNLASGAYGTGPEAMAKANADLNAETDKQWAVDRERAKMGYDQRLGDYTAQRGIALSGAEHDRQQDTATPNPEQALSGGFADRMQNSAPIIGKFGSAGTSVGAKVKDMLPFGIGNTQQTPEFQQYQQARNDFINAQLRRESGAAIAPSEYSNADKQYFPQPGDGPEVLAQKARNRQLAVEGMVRNAGPAYQKSPTVGAPIAAPAPPEGGGQVSGAPKPGTVEQGYRFKGGNPADKSNWEPAQ